MSTLPGLYQGAAVFEDGNGLAQVELRDLARMAARAEFTAGPMFIGGRAFTCRTLLDVRSAFEDGDLCPLESCTVTGCDRPGTETNGFCREDSVGLICWDDAEGGL